MSSIALRPHPRIDAAIIAAAQARCFRKMPTIMTHDACLTASSGRPARYHQGDIAQLPDPSRARSPDVTFLPAFLAGQTEVSRIKVTAQTIARTATDGGVSRSITKPLRILSRAGTKFLRSFWVPHARTRAVPALSPTGAPQQEIIRLAYLLFFGREPESEIVVKEKAEHLGTIEEIRRHFMSSDEFKMRQGLVRSAIDEGYYSPPSTVETIVSEEMLARLFGRIQRQWEKLGSTEPFWSVITSNEFRVENFERHAQEFYNSGNTAASLVDTFANRNGIAVPRRTCLELGCGVGRVTRFLAERFERVIAVDISDGNLSHCIDYMNKSNVKNVETVLVKSPVDLTKLPQIDFLFSIIVLQHNPPPVQRFILDRLLAKISAGGSCLVQLPTHIHGYQFVSTEYLKTEEMNDGEMHCLPMHVVFHLMKAHNFTPVEVLMDGWTGGYGSHTFFATKAT